MTFSEPSPNAARTVTPVGQIGAMADLFAIVGLVTVGLLGVARWWEEH
jgi:hypothetical protein